MASTSESASPAVVPADAPPARRRPAAGWWLAAGAVVGLVGLLVGMYVGDAAYVPGDSLLDAGPIVGWGLPAVKFLAVASGTLTIGFLVSAAFLVPSASRETVSRAGRADLVRASTAAAAWFVSSLLSIIFTHAAVVGMPLGEALRPEVFWTYAFEVSQNDAALFTAIVAATVSLTAALASRTGTAALLAGAAGIGLVAGPINAHGTTLGDHSLALTSGLVHALAAAVWVGGLVAMAGHALRRDPGVPDAMRRFSRLAVGCVIALAISGIGNAYVRLEQFTDLFATAYGVLVLLKVALLVVVVLVASRSRRAVAAAPGSARRLTQWILIEGLLLAVTIGVAVSLTLAPFPRAEVPLPTPAEQILGFPFPAAPTLSGVVFGWYPDALFLLLAAVLAGGYGWGVWRARSRGVAWSWGRVVAWYVGLAFLVFATSLGIAGYAKVSVQWHMAQHMFLAMIVPIFLVLGMPVMLALRALRPSAGRSRGPREWLLWGLHSPLSKLITHPLYVLAMGTFGLFGLYFTPLYGQAMSSHLGHVLMGLHFLLSGFLFYWVVLGLDPGPRQVPAWARLLLLLVYVSLHAFFAVAIMMSAQPLGAEWFSQVQPPWVTDAVKDSIDGGGVAWGFGEIPTVVVMVIVAIQWARSEDRIAKRQDRQADRDGNAELAAYNARLAAMNERAQRMEQRSP